MDQLLLPKFKLMPTLPLILKFCPLLIPLGIVIDSLTVELAVPVPAHVPQGVLIVSPEPWHLLQTMCRVMGPCRMLMWPAPPHVVHFVGAVPGLHLLPWHVPQVVFLVKFISLVIPMTDSMKVISKLSIRSAPRDARPCFCPSPPSPKKSSKSLKAFPKSPFPKKSI